MLNVCLTLFNLPTLVYTQRHLETGLFIVPATKEGVEILMAHWNEWGPQVLPGGRVIPVAAHRVLQVDGVPFSSVGSLHDVKAEFEVRNSSLGKVGTPRWLTNCQVRRESRL
jgi:hypothetical protein